MAEPIQANPYYVIGSVQGLLEMVAEPNREIYRMTPERLVERLREIMADHESARAMMAAYKEADRG